MSSRKKTRAEKIDNEEFHEFRIYQTKVRLTSVSKAIDTAYIMHWAAYPEV